MTAPDHLVVVPAQVLLLLVPAQVLGVEGLEADEHAAHAGGRGTLDQVTAQDRLHGAGSLEQPAHPAHALEQSLGEPPVAQEMVVEEVEVPAGETVDLRERGVDRLRVERPAALVERVLVAEVAVVRTAAGHHDRVGAQVAPTLDQIATHGWDALERAHVGAGVVPRLRAPGAEVGEERLPRALAGAGDDRVGVQRRFIGQRRGVQTPDAHVRASCPIQVGDLPGSSCRGDVDASSRAGPAHRPAPAALGHARRAVPPRRPGRGSRPAPRDRAAGTMRT